MLAAARNWRLPGAKLDLGDFNEHILLDKSSGVARQLLFTPDNPAEFKAALGRATSESGAKAA